MRKNPREQTAEFCAGCGSPRRRAPFWVVVYGSALCKECRLMLTDEDNEEETR